MTYLSKNNTISQGKFQDGFRLLLHKIFSFLLACFLPCRKTGLIIHMRSCGAIGYSGFGLIQWPKYGRNTRVEFTGSTIIAWLVSINLCSHLEE